MAEDINNFNPVPDEYYQPDPAHPFDPASIPGGGFKYVDEGPNHITIEHPNGQQATLGKKNLGENHLAEMRSFPKKDAPQVTPGASGSWDATPGASGSWDSSVPSTATPASMTTNVPQETIPSAPVKNPEQDILGHENDVMSQLAKSQAAAQKQNEQAMQTLQQGIENTKKYYAQQRSDLDTKQAQFEKDYTEGKIDPQQYWHQQKGFKGGFNRVLSLVGLVLGGNAQNRTGVNPAGAMLDKAIQNDIDAQKSNLGKTKSLLDLNMQKYGNLQTAEAATKADYFTAFNAQLAKVASQTQSQQVALNAQIHMDENKIKIQQLNDETAKQQTAHKVDQVISTQPIPDAAIPSLSKDQQEQMVRIGNNQNVKARSKEAADEINKAVPAIDSALSEIDKMELAIRGGKDPSGKTVQPLGTEAYPNVWGMSNLTHTGREGSNIQNNVIRALRAVGKSSDRLNEYSNENYLKDLVQNPAQWHTQEGLDSLARLRSNLMDQKKNMISQGVISSPNTLQSKPGFK